MKKETNKSERSSLSHKNSDQDLREQLSKPKTNSERYKKSNHSKGKSKFLNINLSNINAKEKINYDNNNEPNKDFYKNFLISLKLDNISNHNGPKNKSKEKHRDSLSSCSSRHGIKAIHPVGKEFNQKIKKINLSAVNNKDQVSTNSIEKRKGSNMTNENLNTNPNIIPNTNCNNTYHQQQLPNNNNKNSLIQKKNEQLIDVHQKNYISKRSMQPNLNSNQLNRNASFENTSKKEVIPRKQSLPKQVIDKVIQYQSYQTGLKPEEKPNHLQKGTKLFLCCIPCSNRKKTN